MKLKGSGTNMTKHISQNLFNQQNEEKKIQIYAIIMSSSKICVY